MKTTYATLALAGLAAAVPHNNHRSLHEKKDVMDVVNSAISALSQLADEGQSLMTAIKGGDGRPILPANNKHTATSDSWIGEATSGDAVVNTIVNKSGKDATWFCWGKAGSWVQANKPTIAIKVPKNSNVTVSHAISEDPQNGNSGACAAMFEGDGLNQWGMANQAWMEFTFVKDQWSSSTFDLSMEVNSKGHNMTIAGDKCTSDLTRCSFHCNDASATSCKDAGTYHLLNCAKDSQKATAFYNAFGADEGGCQGISNSGISKLTTTLN